MTATKKVRIVLVGVTVSQYSEVLEVPATMSDRALDVLVSSRY